MTSTRTAMRRLLDDLAGFDTDLEREAMSRYATERVLTQLVALAARSTSTSPALSWSGRRRRTGILSSSPARSA